MNRPLRHALAIALVASALCADRASAIAPALKPEMVSAAGRLVSRLSIRFNRVVAAVRVLQSVSPNRTQTALTMLPVATTAGFPLRLDSTLLHLPPPLA